MGKIRFTDVFIGHPDNSDDAQNEEDESLINGGMIAYSIRIAIMSQPHEVDAQCSQPECAKREKAMAETATAVAVEQLDALRKSDQRA